MPEDFEKIIKKNNPDNITMYKKVEPVSSMPKLPDLSREKGDLAGEYYYKGRNGREYPATPEGAAAMQRDNDAYWESQKIEKDPKLP